MVDQIPLRDHGAAEEDDPWVLALLRRTTVPVLDASIMSRKASNGSPAAGWRLRLEMRQLPVSERVADMVFGAALAC